MGIMRKDLKAGKKTGFIPAQRISGIVKPHLYFSYDARILDCSETFVNLVKISKSNLFAGRLAEHALNNQFIEAIRKAETEGISTFRGNVMFGNNLSPVFLETVFIKTESADQPDKKVICLVLEINMNGTAIQPAYSKDRSAHAISDKLHTSISIHGIDGNALYISPSTEFLFGYSCDELKEINSLNIVYPDDLHIVKNALEKIGKGEDHLNVKYRMVHKNGSVIPVESTSYLISDIHGTGKHIVNITRDMNSQAHIERALHRSEQKYYRLVMNLPAGISLISASGQLLEVNDAMKEIMELSPDIPIPGMNFFDIEAMKRFKITEQLTKCIEAKEIVSGNVTFKTSNKNRGKYLSYSFVPVFNQNNKVDTVIGYVSDLTQQMKSEIESRERADFLNLVINTIKSPFFVKDEEHKWVMLNDAAVEMMGQSRKALIGKTDYDLYTKEQADIFRKYDEFVFKTGSSSNEEQITWSDGKLHTIVTYKQLYIEKSSGKRFIIGTIHDISGYKKIEEELRGSEMKFRELFDNANDFIITMDLKGNITNANRTLLNFLETDLEKFLTHNVYEFVSEENLASAYSFRDKVLDGSLDTPFEIKAIGVNKQAVTYEIRASLIRQKGELAGVQCVFSDVTERRETRLNFEKYNKDLLELNKTKDKFFSIIAHDLRNSSSSLIGFSEMLIEDLNEMSKDEIRDSLRIIYNSAKHSFNLLNNLLAWSRMQTGHMPFDPAALTLISVVEEVIDVLFSLAYRKRIEINNRVKPGILAYADKNMLNTILNNLVMNAIKFTPVGGLINIYTGDHVLSPESGKDFITVSVSDTGIGMDAETVSKLFTGIKSTSVLGTEKEEGTGLGLMLACEMVEKHQGRIWAESTLSKGSVFSFLIPAYVPGNGDS